MLLPKQDAEGTPYISYSQVKLWNEAKGFSTGLLGRHEYIRSYFLGEQYADKGGFGQFGTEVENYICKRENADQFTDAERAVLDQIEPLGIFQKQIKIPFDGFYLTGYIDDVNPEYTKIRDYKSASVKSKEKYYADDYWQLDLYSLFIKKEQGKLPKELEVCIIERLGNGFKGGRAAMTVGTNIWYVPRKTNKERLKTIEQNIINTATEISKYYEVFCKLNQ